MLRPVRDVQGDVVAELAPAEVLSIDFQIDFADAAIGRQARRLTMENGAFLHELADCRTFCRREEVEAMRAAGLALGGSLDNAVVVDGARVLNPGGLRRADEFVRHKMLDALGDLGARRRADPRRLPRRAGRARRDQPAAAPAVRDARAPSNGSRSMPRRRHFCPARASARRTCAAPVEAGHSGH